MASEPRPVLNPVLSFKRESRPETIEARGPDESSVRNDRLPAQRKLLSKRIRELRKSPPRAFKGKFLLSIDMFDDSLAPSHEPKWLFRESRGFPLVAPSASGYVAEVPVHALSELEDLISSGSHVALRSSISRIRDISAHSESSVLRGRSVDRVWDSSIEFEGGRIFSAWLAPFASGDSRDGVVEHLLNLQERELIQSIADFVAITREPGSDSDQLQIQLGANSQSIARAAREYRQSAHAKMQFIARDASVLTQLIASGAVFRLDPIRELHAAEIPTAPDPGRPVPDEQWQPVVGIVDGGLFAKSYEAMVSWRAPSLVSDVSANRSHGNRVASLVVHGHAWNTHLDLPALTCRIGVAQAITKDSQGATTRPKFLSYLRSVIARHHGDTKVWNLSFNEPVFGDDPLEMSELGHEIHKISREFGVLPVISIGNVDKDNSARLCPPADCESALSVGGLQADKNGGPGDPCPVCLPGPGPEGLTKPELAWFSTLRGLGGTAETGSSYAAAITSSVAAHTFHNLKSPTPDLVRALLINRAGKNSHDHHHGWGCPSPAAVMPWVCAEGTVTLVWTAELRTGYWHRWSDIPIPPELIHAGKLKGRVALTAILNPVVSELGSSNYFSTRLQVALQYTKPGGKTGNLAGSMKEDHTPEMEARAEWQKWNPVRHHAKTIRGIAFEGGSLQVCARVFGRDLYLHGLSKPSEVEPCKVAFVLTLSAPEGSDANSSIYSSVARQLGAYVDSAVTDIEVSLQS